MSHSDYFAMNFPQPKFKSNDSRDYTKEPPAMLDVDWVITMKIRLKEFVLTGNVDWFQGVSNG